MLTYDYRGLPPNKALELTPMRGPKIVAILTVRT